MATERKGNLSVEKYDSGLSNVEKTETQNCNKRESTDNTQQLGPGGGGDHPWPWLAVLHSRSDPSGSTTPFPFFTESSRPLSPDVFPYSVKNMPSTLRDLLERPCRIISSNEKLPCEEYFPDRVNFIVDKNGCIIDIRFF